MAAFFVNIRGASWLPFLPLLFLLLLLLFFACLLLIFNCSFLQLPVARRLRLLLELPTPLLLQPSLIVVVDFSHASFVAQSKSFSQSVHAQALSLSHPLLLGLSAVAVAVASCH